MVGGVEDFFMVPKGTPIEINVPGGSKATVVTEEDGAWMSMDAINRTLKAS